MVTWSGGGAIDHLIVAARDLESGRAWVQDMLGVPLQPGGEHEMFGTHNALLSLGGEEYLEVLAVNREVPKPCAVYPLGLELPEVVAQVGRSPYLHHWVARAELSGSESVEYCRGDNRWRTVIHEPGHLPMGGVAPSLIQWLTPPPCRLLPDSGVRLKALALGTPQPDVLEARLAGIGRDTRISVERCETPTVTAVLDTPRGEVTL